MRSIFYAIIVVMTACEDAPKATLRAPEKQYLFDNLHFENQPHGTKFWSGHAKQADGDLQKTHMTNLVFKIKETLDAVENDTISAESGILGLNQDNAEFTNLVFEAKDGSRALAKKGTYIADRDILRLEQNVELFMHGMLLHAPEADIHIDQGSAILPFVQGRFEPQK